LGGAIQKIQIAAESKILPKLQEDERLPRLETVFRWRARFTPPYSSKQKSHFVGGGAGAAHLGSFVSI